MTAATMKSNKETIIKKTKPLTKRQKHKLGPNKSNTWPQQPKYKSMDARDQAYIRMAGLGSQSTKNKSSSSSSSKSSSTKHLLMQMMILLIHLNINLVVSLHHHKLVHVMLLYLNLKIISRLGLIQVMKMVD